MFERFTDKGRKIIILAREEAERHQAECPACREVQAAWQCLSTALLSRPSFIPPADLKERIVSQIVHDIAARRKMRTTAAVVVALAAGVLLVLFVHMQWLRPAGIQRGPDELVHLAGGLKSPAPSLEESVAEARLAVTDLTRRAADETVEQTLILLPATFAAPPLVGTGDFKPLEPSARSLREAGQVVSSGLEPVASSAKRALDLFIRDLPVLELGEKRGF